MKKSNFIAMILGTISCIFFALGMCMTMLPEWNSFRSGVIVGCVGLIFTLITVLVWRKMENKAPIKFTGKAVGTVFLGIIGALTLGVGMCLVMVWGNLLWGVVVGVIGIMLLLCLIGIVKGIN